MIHQNELFDFAATTEPTGAYLSPDGKHRYFLWRRWSMAPPVLWIMLNPSTAGERTDDPTIRRCVRFAESWGCGGSDVVNLFSIRSPDPRAILSPDMAELAGNAYVIGSAIRDPRYRHRIIAWGVPKWRIVRERIDDFWDRYSTHKIECLGETKDGHPRHPLYVRHDVTPRLHWRCAYREDRLA